MRPAILELIAELDSARAQALLREAETVALGRLVLAAYPTIRLALSKMAAGTPGEDDE